MSVSTFDSMLNILYCGAKGLSLYKDGKNSVENIKKLSDENSGVKEWVRTALSIVRLGADGIDCINQIKGQSLHQKKEIKTLKESNDKIKKIALVADIGERLLSDEASEMKIPFLITSSLRRIIDITENNPKNEGIISNNARARFLGAIVGDEISKKLIAFMERRTNITNIQIQNVNIPNNNPLNRVPLDVINMNYNLIPDQFENDEVLNQYICPITREPIRYPVSYDYIDTHNHTFIHTYERSAIYGWLISGNNTDPMTRQTVNVNSYYENMVMRNAIENRLNVLQS